MSVIEVEVKEKWETGSIRNSREGKGRYDLIAPLVSFDILIYSEGATPYKQAFINAFNYLRNYLADRRVNALGDAFSEIALAIDQKYGYDYAYMEKLAKHYENGANIYSERNWEKGQNVCRYIDSAMRHIIAILQDKEDEDHEAASLWNILAIAQTLHMIAIKKLPKELDDRPLYV